MERNPPPDQTSPSGHHAGLVSPHQSVGADVQTLVPQQRDPGPSPYTVQAPPLPNQSLPHWGLVSGRWRGEMAARAHGDT